MEEEIRIKMNFRRKPENDSDADNERKVKILKVEANTNTLPIANNVSTNEPSLQVKSSEISNSLADENLVSLPVNHFSVEDELQSHEALTVIGRQYGIVKNIMSFLPMSDLKHMSSVSHTWHVASKTEQRWIQRTHSISQFSWEPSAEVLMDQKVWKQSLADGKGKDTVFASGMTRFSKGGLLESKVQALENSPLQNDVQRHFKQKIKDGIVEPSVAIVFSVGDVEVGEDSLSVSDVVNPKSFHLNMAEIEKSLPPKCEIISTCSRGIIVEGTKANKSAVKEIENNGTRIYPAVSAFVLPTFYSPKISKNKDKSNIKRVKMIPFDIPEYRNYVAEKTDMLCAVNGQRLEDVEDTALKDREIRRQLMKQVFCKNRLKDEDTIKCVIALSNVNQNPSLLKFLYAAAADWGTPGTDDLKDDFDPEKEQTIIPSIAIGGAVGKLCRYSKSCGPNSLKDILEEHARWEQSVHEHSDDDADFLTGERAASYKRSVGLVFAGDGIEAASVILPPNVRNPNKVTKQLLKLKASKNLGDLDNPDSRSFAFMFACCGRGKQFHNDKGDVESKCFKTLFPNTPLMGIFGEGEFGWNYMPDVKPKRSKSHQGGKGTCTSQPRYKKLREEDVCHSYTTVFVVLSINTGDPEEDANTAANISKFANSSMSSN